MATTYTASFEFSCWKQHTCLSCNTPYQYVLKRKVKGEAGTEEAAFVAAQNAAVKAMDDDVDQHPCPKCGYVQPDMIAAKQRPLYWTAMVVGVGGLLAAFIPAFAHGFTIETSAYVAAAAMGGALLFAMIGSLHNPNGNLRANVAKSDRRMEEGQLRLAPDAEAEAHDDAGREFEEAVPKPFSSGNVVALTLLALGVVAAIAPPLVRSLAGWPLNDRWYPAVVGPGDESTFYFEEELSSLKGYWRAHVEEDKVLSLAHLDNAADLGAKEDVFQGRTKESDWPETISVKGSGQPSNTMWSAITFPEDEALADETGTLTLLTVAVFPNRADDQWNLDGRVFNATVAVRFASANAGGNYHQIWMMGQIAALVLCVFAGVTLLRSAGALVAVCHPTGVFPTEGAAEGEVEAAEE